MNGRPLFNRITGVGVAAFCFAALSSLATTAHAETNGSGYSTVTAGPNAAVSQAALSPLTTAAPPQEPTLVLPQDRTLMFLGAQIWAFPQEPTLVLSPSAVLWGG